MSRQEIEIGNAAAYLEEAVHKLCDLHGDVKGRLLAAAPEIMSASIIIQALPEGAVPAEFREQMESIVNRLSKRASHRRPRSDLRALGAVGSTLFGMHKRTASPIARDVRRAHDMIKHIIERR